MEVVEKDCENKILEISLIQVGNIIYLSLCNSAVIHSIRSLLELVAGSSPKKMHKESQMSESNPEEGQGID